MSLDAFSQAFAGTDWDKLSAAARPNATAPAATTTAAAAGAAQTGLSGGNAPAKTADAASADQPFLTFGDVIDAVNPLQHIPIIDGIYRHVTGDTIRPQGTIMGGLLYGGLIGGALATAGVLVQEVTGVDPEEAVIAYLTGDHGAEAATQTAAAPTTTLAATDPQTGKPQPSPPAIPGPGAGAAATPPAATPPAATPPAANANAAANQSALHQLAADLGAGGQVQGPQPPAGAAAPAPVADGQPHPSRMPTRGMVASNANPPPPLNGPGRRFGGYAQSAAMVAASPNRTAGTAPGPAAAAGAPMPAAPAPLARTPVARGPIVPPGTNQMMRLGGAPAIKPLSAGPEIKALDAAQPPSALPLQAPLPITDSPPLPAVPIGPAAISEMMMRNLDKYQAQATARSAGRPVARTATTG